MTRSDPPSPPSEDELRELRRTGRRRGATQDRLTVGLITTTPIFGGGVRAGELDKRVPIRVPSIRGHLRFWWRALRPAGTAADTMREAEQQLFGGAGGDDGAASNVIVTVSNVERVEADQARIDLHDVASYALFPARGERREPDKPRWKPGLRFTLTVDAPSNEIEAVRQSVVAWILFGGYGGRTRRGLGALACATPAGREEWLPTAATAAALTEQLGSDVFGNPQSVPPIHTPRLAGATLLAGSDKQDGNSAWREALGLLRTFRQGETVAREQGQDRRPGRSRWPEADKVRQLVGRMTAHKPRYNQEPSWPRAAFGLPIVARFQQRSRAGGNYVPPEPGSFEVGWRDATGKRRDRLASPLILKPLALRDGRFVPIALWLDRAFPEGDLVAKITDGGWAIDPIATAAPFGRILGEGDQAWLQPLVGHGSVRDAFQAWIRSKKEWSLAAGEGPR